MKSQQSFVLLAMLGMVTLSSGHIGGGKTPFQDMNPQFYCGRNLARVLANLCNDGEADKRSEGTMFNSILAPYYKDQESQFGWPWITQQKARVLGLPSRAKRYIVNECCDKACNINELYSYCYSTE